MTFLTFNLCEPGGSLFHPSTSAVLMLEQRVDSYLSLASGDCSLGLLNDDLLGLSLLALHLHSLPTLDLDLPRRHQLYLWGRIHKKLGTTLTPLFWFLICFCFLF